MQYFAVLEDTKNLRWQAELLYESIRLLDLQDQFLVAVCPGSDAIHKHPFPDVVYFDNMGRQIGYPHLNKCYGLAKAIQSGRLKQPFTILETDMFLLNEIPESNQPVTAQKHKRLGWEFVREDLVEFASSSSWADLGGVYQFNGVPNKVFEDTIKFTYDLFQKLGNKPDLHNYGFNLAIKKYGVPYDAAQNYEMPLLSDRKGHACVVHYRDGYLPYFNKEKPYESINFSFNVPLPMRTLLDAPSNNLPNVVVMQTLIRSWVESNLIRIRDLL